MDDGARTRRFAPYFANSGFFYLRNTYRVRQFWDQFTLMSGLMAYWKSQQQLLALALEFASGQFGLSVRVLPWQRYVHCRLSYV
jgi:hypothetical protein